MTSKLISSVAFCALAALGSVFIPLNLANDAESIAPAGTSAPGPQDAAPTATPIKHLVIIFNENVSFDHYFATYPKATNPPGEPRFIAAAGTPTVNNLANANLLRRNPN